MDKKPNKIKNFVLLFIKHFTMAQVSASAAVLAYYSLLSVFPAIIVVGNLLPMLGLNAKTVLDYLQTAIPESVYDFLRPIIYDFLQHGNGGTLTLVRSVALWSTSLGIAAFQRSVNHAYGVAENQNPIINRAVSFLWMLVILLIVTTLVILYGLGEQTLRQPAADLGFSTKYVTFFRSIKWPVTFWALFVFLTLLYYFVPNALVKLATCDSRCLDCGSFMDGTFPGLFLLHDDFAHNITSYKTIGAFIVLMIWLDLSGMVIMIGATINATLQDAHDGEIKERSIFGSTCARCGIASLTTATIMMSINKAKTPAGRTCWRFEQLDLYLVKVRKFLRNGENFKN